MPGQEVLHRVRVVLGWSNRERGERGERNGIWLREAGGPGGIEIFQNRRSMAFAFYNG